MPRPHAPPANLTFGIVSPSTAGNQGTTAPTAASLPMAAGPHFRLRHLRSSEPHSAQRLSAKCSRPPYTLTHARLQRGHQAYPVQGPRAPIARSQQQALCGCKLGRLGVLGLQLLSEAGVCRRRGRALRQAQTRRAILAENLHIEAHPCVSGALRRIACPITPRGSEHKQLRKTRVQACAGCGRWHGACSMLASAAKARQLNDIRHAQDPRFRTNSAFDRQGLALSE